MSRPTYEELEQERNELAAQVERFYQALRHLRHNAYKSGANMGLAIDVADDVLAETPPAALASLKAQWQAEAVKNFLELIDESIGVERDAGRNVSGDTIEMVARSAREFKQRAQEAGDA